MWSNWILPIFLLLCSIFTIASNSIGIQCVGDSKDSSKKNFLIFNLIAAIIAFFVSLWLIRGVMIEGAPAPKPSVPAPAYAGNTAGAWNS